MPIARWWIAVGEWLPRRTRGGKMPIVAIRGRFGGANTGSGPANSLIRRAPMHWLLGWALALAGAAETAPPADGTLIFLENCSSLVERATHGQIGHAALVFRDGDACYVYE